MKLTTIAKLCCPFDKHNLQLKTLAHDVEQNVIDGILTCTECKRNYPIIYGVPIMAPDEYRQIALEQLVIDRWKIAYGIEPLKLLP
ncbi:Trm112 family protein [Mucilaginibacter sp. KACC 22063]|uniref:Trm112 family protein n=1 Tax=Mucilaginibacter sp. KACC 22063 TaxID=3025666 RepID=UPI002366203C|nr:Trm112 family protein [Mucilaginibacter sp. KACC 22063]WDF57373.1 Trm112 family protein [Mucilaginibacter sp. KACC 22063]